jgi:hypothetical protein
MEGAEDFAAPKVSDYTEAASTIADRERSLVPEQA